MRLTAKDFSEISTALEELEKLSVTVREAEVAGHKLVLRKEESGYIVKGITNSELSGGGVTR